MKRFSSLLSVLIILVVVYWSFSDLKPSETSFSSKNDGSFSVENALNHVKNMSSSAHYVGSDDHKKVQQYILDELTKMGLKPELQTQTAVNQKWFGATTAQNILARIKGAEKGKVLLLLSHYDSNPHSSKGASDAGSGVAVILEGVRAFLEANKTPKNDIIILISDAEELGLLGAQAFVDAHPWAKDIGLVLNFEARGSGGPSYMLMETNGKNSKLLSEFIKANPNFPAANSLMYSIYKQLPNDTDLTVFRKDANINGFNFAFIGDHFDYHTAQDSYERLDKETLLHQVDYLTSTLSYFAFSNLNNFTSDEDFVYVSFPFTGLLTYSFSWILPMLIIASVLFFVLFFFGVSLGKLTLKGSFKGFIPFLISVIFCGGFSFGLWQLLLVIHPQYQDILHGFTYNGYIYIAAFVCLNLFLCLKIYSFFKKQEKVADLLIAPIFIWLIINGLIVLYLQGAGFFIIPVFSALFILMIAVFMSLEVRANRILATIISIPTLYIFAPMIKMFPVGLGLKNSFISGLLIALLFGLMIFTFHQKKSSWLQKLMGFFAVALFVYASFNSGFSNENKKPNSIVYIQNSDENKAFFGTYNKTLDDYTKQIFDESSKKGSLKNAETTSKYNTRFTHYKETDFKNIAASEISINLDTVLGDKRFLDITITPQRKVNKLEFISNKKINFEQFKVNDVLVNKGKPYTTKRKTFLIYYLSNEDDEVSLSFSVDKNAPLNIFINEISYDLLTNQNFNLQPRTEEMMPMPFVTNDAIIITKKLEL